jgi:hypothetical protein
MGHRPVDVEPETPDRLSRPAELVQRAKQLAQLTNFQFGRNAVATLPAANVIPVTASPVASVPSAARELSFDDGVDDEAFTGAVATSVAPARAATQSMAMVAPAAKTTAQKLADFYGVKQVGDEILFAAKFDNARKVLIAGDFNNWSPMSTPMITNNGADWRTSLPLPPGRYRYRFVVDGKWLTDPHNSYVEANQFGELNNVVEVD